MDIVKSSSSSLKFQKNGNLTASELNCVFPYRLADRSIALAKYCYCYYSKPFSSSILIPDSKL